MKRARRVNRAHARALKARAKATEARERLTAFESKGLPEFGDRRWAQLSRIVEQTEADATRLEKAAKESANAKKREAAERATREALAAKNGTLLEVNEDRSALRRVTSCADCGRCVAVVDRDALRELGWFSRWSMDKAPPVRRFWCPDCAVIPRLSEPSPGPAILPASIATIAGLKAGSRRRKRLVAELRRLEEVDPARARAYVAQLATDPAYRQTCRRTVDDLIGGSKA